MILVFILLATFLSSLLSLFGGLILLAKRRLSQSISNGLVSFAAGTLLATAFLDLLPEALDLVEDKASILLFTLAGMVFFFFTERFLFWFHHHHGEIEETKPSNSLILIGDSVHNFIDGVLIAGSFLVSPGLGLTTSVAVFLHEIPQEISDFTILLYGGMKRSKVLFYNLLSAMSAVLGALIGYFFLKEVSGLIPILLSLGAGMFVYIAGSDLIPEVHKVFQRRQAVIQSLFFLAAITVVWLARFWEVK